MINWGSVPEWLAGGGALLALLWARKAARAAGRTNEQQAEQLRRQQQQWADQRAARDAEQAEKIAAWIEFEDSPLPEGVTSIPASEMRGDYRYCLRNASELPIFEVTVSVLPPGNSDVEEAQYESFQPVVAPENAPTKVLFAKSSKMRSWRIELKFRDARNQCWRRSQFGVLTPDHWEPMMWDLADRLEGSNERGKR